MSYECDDCEMLNEEVNDIQSELDRYKANEFINFFASFANVRSFSQTYWNNSTKKEREFSEKVTQAYELCVAVYIHNTITENMLEIIATECGENFSRKIIDIYKRHFNKEPFKKKD